MTDDKKWPGGKKFGKTSSAEKRRQERLKCKREKQAARQKANRDRKYEQDADIVAVGPSGLVPNVDGSAALTHGFYRRALDEWEAEKANELHNMFRTKYGLDELVDDLDLYFAVTSFVKSMRPEPEDKENTKSVRSTQAFHARMFRDFIESLGLHRKQRAENSQGSEVAEAIKGLFSGAKHKEPTEMVLDSKSGKWVRKKEADNEEA